MTGMLHAVHIIGPSGAGKTHTLGRLEALGFIVFDLDVVGRREGSTWQSWYIPREIYPILATREWTKKKHQAIAGVDSDGPGMIAASRAAGFTVVGLLPPAEIIRSQREDRGDKEAKVMESKDSYQSWTKILRQQNVPTFGSGDDIIAALIA